jgi:hypothetical protein
MWSVWKWNLRSAGMISSALSRLGMLLSGYSICCEGHESSLKQHTFVSSVTDPQPDPDPYVFGPLGSRTDQQAKKKTTDVSVPAESTVISKITYLKNYFFCWHLESLCKKEQDPDPYQNVTDPEHCKYDLVSHPG